MQQLRESIPQHIRPSGRKKPPATQYFIFIPFCEHINGVGTIKLIMLHSVIGRNFPSQPVMKNLMPQPIHSYGGALIQRTISMLRKHNLSHCSAPVVG
jgi:hypothetical protein